MDYIIRYLKNPIAIGVYSSRVRIDLKPFDKFAEYILKHCDRTETTRVRGYLKLGGVFSVMDLLNKLSFALSELREQGRCGKILSDFYDDAESGRREAAPLYQEIFGEEYRAR